MRSFKYASMVFVGACCLGVLSSIMKLGMEDGFTVGELLNSQYFFGLCMMLVFVPFFASKRLSIKSCGAALAIALSIGFTSIFYGLSVEQLPASLAIVLLFQFTWIGIGIECMSRKAWPTAEKLIALILLFVGTLLAGGVFQNSFEGEISAAGVGYGLLSALSFAIYIFFSGKLLTDVPPVKRSFYITLGITALMLIVYSPSFLFDGAIPAGLWKYGLLLGVLGTVVPITFFAAGVPKIGAGNGTILSAAELPAAVIAAQTVLQESVLFLQWFGIMLILAGIAYPFLVKGRMSSSLTK